MIKHIKDIIQGKAVVGKRRSKHWRRVRNEFKRKNPTCEGCGGTKTIEIHHVIPFSVDPTLELVESNLMTLCERGKYGITCHQLLGHRGNYRKVNKDVERDAKYWLEKIKAE